MWIDCKKLEKDHSFMRDYSTLYSKNIYLQLRNI